MANQFQKRNIGFEGFIVTKMDCNPKMLCEKSVRSIDEFNDDSEYIFILGMNDKNKLDVIDMLYNRDIILI